MGFSSQNGLMNTVSFELYTPVLLDYWAIGGFMSLKISYMWFLLYYFVLIVSNIWVFANISDERLEN